MTVKLEWNGPQVTEALRAGAARGLSLAAEHLLAESTKVVPIEEGTLSRSGATSVDEGSLIAAVSYDTPYAVRQHEELDYRHDAGRQAKYLEEPFHREGPVVQRIIGTEISKELQ